MRRCRCGHDRAAHRHYRPGSDCYCGCRRWRWRPRILRGLGAGLLALAFLAAIGLALIGLHVPQ
jgi:hypothetical protein